jgi:ubiquinone/menaquinone biosynthesis C-methylase UbiE
MNLDPANIFKGTAQYYRQFRRPYPEELFSDLIDYYHLDGKGRLLDLGCGTGELTVPLSKNFQGAIGIDPNPEMLLEAEARAKEANISNVEWIKQRAEEIDRSLGNSRLTTAGVSFHWMNQQLVLRKIYEMTDKDGGMAIIGDMSPVRGKEKTEGWKVKRKELIIKYLGEERRAGDHLHKEFIPEKKPFEDLIPESSFKTFDLKTYEYTTERNIDEIVGFLYSTSYANKRLFGDKAEEFEKELRTELLRLIPSNQFIEEGRVQLFLMRK